MFKGPILFIQFDEFLLVALEDIDLVLEMPDNDVLLV